ncbi:MAG: hypothetical protein JWQ52_1618 [Phenylobacterium sp.]|jgi:endonuclease/exonuclease/phosphatase (EEP) superfamily protein YafD|nr:hypothetical protein [Phenylobacterium sp.]
MRLLRVLFTAILVTFLLGLGAVCAAAAVAAQWGRTSLDFDVLTHFAPFWLAGALVATFAGLAFRGPVRALIVGLGLVGTLAAGALIAPELVRPTGPHAAPGAPDQLKIVQFNAWHNNADLQRTVDWLVREAPDIVVIEETTPPIRAMIAARTNWYVTCPKCEVMILSRRPPVADGVAFLGHRSGPLSRATFRDPRGEFTVLGVHNAWPTDPDQPMQERRLAAAVARFPRERTIVTGDFNSTPWSFSRRRWDRALGLVRRERALFSWPAVQYKRLRWIGFPYLAIDHVYAGSGWATVSVRRGPKLGSDHYPVVVILAPVAPR